MKTVGYAAHSSDAHMQPYHFERRALRDNDVAIEILYSGICHSDLHTVNGDWGPQNYPLVPGHEIIGQVLEVGPSVTKFKAGDKVGVGCMVDSCQSCDQCDHGEEQYCRHGLTATYGSPDRISGETTQGGYSKHIVVREEFVLSVPDALDMARAAPILCAGRAAEHGDFCAHCDGEFNPHVAKSTQTNHTHATTLADVPGAQW